MAAGDVVITRVIPLGRKAKGQHMVVGTVTLDGSNPTPVTLTNILAAIDGAVVSMDGSSAPAADPTFLTHAISGATLNIYAWKITGAGDATLIASTNNARDAHFVVVGQRKADVNT